MKKMTAKLTGYALAAVLLGGTVACSGGGNDTSSVADDLEDSQLYEAIRSKDLGNAGSIADSMAIDVDELTNGETVAVLLAYLEIHNSAVEKGDTQKDLITLRKFVDVYDLSLGRDSKGMREALESARQINPVFNVDSLVRHFRARLAEYDAINGGDLTKPDAASADTAKVQPDSSKTVQPVAPAAGQVMAVD